MEKDNISHLQKENKLLEEALLGTEVKNLKRDTSV